MNFFNMYTAVRLHYIWDGDISIWLYSMVQSISKSRSNLKINSNCSMW
eukprot:SAG11_NODE_40253_length_206_cov_42.000000_1_plen_47_part_01